MDSGRVTQVLNNPAVAMNPQLAFGSEVARLPMNPLRSPLEALASLPVNPMYRLPTSSTITPAEQMMANLLQQDLMEQDRMIRNVMTIQRLNALQGSSRAAAL